MSPILIALICLDVVLLLGVIVLEISKVMNSDKECCTCEAAPVEEPAAECAKEEAVEPVKEEKEEPVVEEKVEEVAVAAEPVEENAVEDSEDDREVAKRIPFSHKMLFIDKKTQSYYDVLNNKFRSLRKINPRVSSKGVSYRLGRELVAKITVRGKTMKLHLALDVNKFDEKIYFQKNLSDVKSYAEVPFTVKVKSDRGLKNALKLVDALVEEKAIEKKTRYTEIDSIEALKEIAKK